MGLIALIAGMACAGVGGELFVRGSVGIARHARVSPGIIGATVAAFATSTPELSVAITSAVAGSPQIALGDALGSNVVNVALILGCALAISGIQTPRSGLKRDFPVALLVPVVTGALLLDGLLSRIDGAMMLLGFGVWLGATLVEARRERTAAAEILAVEPAWRAVVGSVAGVVLLAAAGYLVVSGARSLAAAFGVADFVVGATVVAVGTSLPELATTIIAKLRGHDEVGLGTILGSIEEFWSVLAEAGENVVYEILNNTIRGSVFSDLRLLRGLKVLPSIDGSRVRRRRTLPAPGRSRARRETPWRPRRSRGHGAARSSRTCGGARPR